MSGNGKDELRQIQTQIEHNEMNLEALKKKKDKLQADLTELDKSKKEIDPIVEKYKKDYEANKNNERDIITDYEYWKPLVKGSKDDVGNARKEIDSKIKFLEKKVNGLLGDKEDSLFTWEKIKPENGGNPPVDNENLKDFLTRYLDESWAKDAKISYVSQSEIKISDDQGHLLSFELKENENKVFLNLNDGRSSEFSVKKEGTEHNVFYKSIEEAENDYKIAQKNNKKKVEAFDKLKNLQKSIDENVKKGQDSYKSIDIENNKGAKKNKKILCYYAWEMKDAKDELKDLNKGQGNYETELNDSLDKLKNTKIELGRNEVKLNVLKAELDAAQKKLNELKKSRNKDILDRLNGQ